MASQVAHIIYAQKYFEKHPMPKDEQELFLMGCVFPDIRRIDETIKRQDTHMCHENCDLNFTRLSPFQAGWKFHLYCDMKREEILNKYDFYALSGTGDFWHLPDKLLEDELVYEKYNNWEKLVGFFNNVPAVDTGNGVSHETLSLWYAILAKYIEKKPDDRAMQIFLSKQPSLVDKKEGVIASVDKLRKNKKAVEILNKVMEEIV